MSTSETIEIRHKTLDIEIPHLNVSLLPSSEETLANMNSLQAPSLQSLMDSDRGSNDSLLAESLQLDLDEVGFVVLFNVYDCLRLHMDLF